MVRRNPSCFTRTTAGKYAGLFVGVIVTSIVVPFWGIVNKHVREQQRDIKTAIRISRQSSLALENSFQLLHEVLDSRFTTIRKEEIAQLNTRLEWLQQVHVRGNVRSSLSAPSRLVPFTAEGDTLPIGLPFNASIIGCKRKYLIAGSAPYLPQWWKEHRNIILNNDFRVIALNNAWKVIGVNDLDMWEVPMDFNLRGSVHPTDGELKAMRCVRLYSEPSCQVNPLFIVNGTNVTNTSINMLHIPESYAVQGTQKPWYYHRSGGTMLLNTLYDIPLLEKGQLKDTCVIITGADMAYGKQARQKSFYKKGTADVFRYGLRWIEQELNHVYAQLVEGLGMRIFNAGYSLNTYLPFDRLEMPFSQADISILESQQNAQSSVRGGRVIGEGCPRRSPQENPLRVENSWNHGECCCLQPNDGHQDQGRHGK